MHGSSNQYRSRSSTRRAKRTASAGVQRLVGVGAEDEVGPGGGARGPEPRRVLLGSEPADLELHAGQALLAELRDLRRDVLPPVVAADRDHRQAVAVPAPEPVERLAERLADRVPDGGVHTGRRDEAESAVAQDVERRRPGELPAALDAEGVLADQARRDLRPHDRVDLVEARVLVAAVRLADDALLGADPGHDRRAVGHLVRAAVVGLGERHTDRDRLDLRDRQARDRAVRTDVACRRRVPPRDSPAFGNGSSAHCRRAWPRLSTSPLCASNRSRYRFLAHA